MPVIKEKSNGMVEVTEQMIEANAAYRENGIVPGHYPTTYLAKFKSHEEESRPSMDNLPMRRVLSVAERQSLTQAKEVYGYADLATAGNFVPGSRGVGAVEVPYINIHRNQLNAQQKEVLKTLKEGTPEPVKPEDRDRLKKLAEELREKFTDPEYFQTINEIRVFSVSKPEYYSASEKAAKWSQPQAKLKGYSPEQLANAYKNIMRRLEPDNPNADSLDRLRRSH